MVDIKPFVFGSDGVSDAYAFVRLPSARLPAKVSGEHV